MDNRKNYVSAEIKLTELNETDVIRTSGLDAPLEDDPFGEWEI